MKFEDKISKQINLKNNVVKRKKWYEKITTKFFKKYYKYSYINIYKDDSLWIVIKNIQW